MDVQARKELILKWIREYKFGAFFDEDKQMLIEGDKIQIWIYTQTNEFNIVSRGDYLGCVSSNRKPRAGEDWNRGSDLPDGKFSKELWQEIMGSIVMYEMVNVHHRPWETPMAIRRREKMKSEKVGDGLPISESSEKDRSEVED